jgi:hypothetical protein
MSSSCSSASSFSSSSKSSNSLPTDECDEACECAPRLAGCLVDDVADGRGAEADDGECADQASGWMHDRGIVACSGVGEQSPTDRRWCAFHREAAQATRRKKTRFLPRREALTAAGSACCQVAARRVLTFFPHSLNRAGAPLCASATVRDDAIPHVLTPTMMEQTLHRLAASLRGADRAAKNRPHHALFPPIEKLFSIQITHPMRTCGVPR